MSSRPFRFVATFSMFSLLLLVSLFVPGPGFAEAKPDSEGPAETNSEKSALDPGRWSIQPPGHTRPLVFSMLVTVDGIIGPSRTTGTDAGFDLSDARLALRGDLEKGFGYFVQAQLTQRTPLLDAIIDWKSEQSGTTVSAGYFRTPFSGELLIAAPVLDFIDRSQIVRALAPARQIGVQVDQALLGQALVVRAGVFNGNGLNVNDDERPLYTLRFDGRVRVGEEMALVYGLNGAYSKDDDVDLGLGLPSNFAGERWLAGVDLRMNSGPLFVSAEALYGRIAPSGPTERNVYGYQGSIGWNVTDAVQVLARYDALYAASFRSDRDLAIGSVAVDFTDYISAQAEIRIPTRGEDPSPGGVVNLNLTF